MVVQGSGKVHVTIAQVLQHVGFISLDHLIIINHHHHQAPCLEERLEMLRCVVSAQPTLLLLLSCLGGACSMLAAVLG